VTIWLDAQLSPALATWISETLDVTCKAVRELGLRDAADGQIFEAARAAAAVVMTKHADFVRLLERHGPPPHVLWVTCGNTSNQVLRQLLRRVWPDVRAMLEAGESLVEISDTWRHGERER
jgi:predicted nuclease of predicted toxin-antitoxin system